MKLSETIEELRVVDMFWSQAAFRVLYASMDRRARGRLRALRNDPTPLDHFRVYADCAREMELEVIDMSLLTQEMQTLYQAHTKRCARSNDYLVSVPYECL